MDSFFIVTPVYNAENTIARTIDSILNQTFEGEVRYHIQDGGSTDNTIGVVEQTISKAKIPGNISISYASEEDYGMYDAIRKGFDSFGDACRNSDWFTWINADDYLEPSALSDVISCCSAKLHMSVKWLSGRISVLKEDGDLFLSEYDLHNSYVLASGAADGRHWPFLQQEGTFFRAECYRYACSKKAFSKLQFASDWNLWRILAEQYQLHLISKPLGTFCKTPGQISQLHRDKYESEIDSVVPQITRQSFIAGEHIPPNLIAYIFDMDSAGNIKLREHSLLDQLQYRKKLLSEQQGEQRKPLEYRQELLSKLSIKHNHIYLDGEWQYPAKTEKNAFENLFSLKISGDVCLVSFPWATYIDLHNNRKPRALDFEYILNEISEFTRKFRRVVTVCQHIYFERYISIFQELNITDVFWSHDTRLGSTTAKCAGIKTHPFPLYAVNFAQENLDTGRDLLFNFIGAKSDKYYLTDTRNRIFRLLKDAPGGLVASRESWHFQELVYSKQINEEEEKDALETANKSEEFKTVLARSIFTLCPSGSGPNSIRLWEAIGSGSIPVILADTYLPPGDFSLWQQAVVFCEESEEAIKNLPLVLLRLSKDATVLAEMRQAMKKLWLMYGPSTFVHDVENYLRDEAVPVDKCDKYLSALDLKFLMELAEDRINTESGVPLSNALVIRLTSSPEQFKMALVGSSRDCKLFKSIFEDSLERKSSKLLRFYSNRFGIF